MNTSTTVVQWEYWCDTYYTYQNDMQGYLNGYGEQGWELASAHFSPSDQNYQQEYYRIILKRPKTNTNEQG